MNSSLVSASSTVEINDFIVPWIESEQRIGLPNLHFSPANGIPAASYQSFFCQFEQNFNISAMDSRGAWSESGVPDESLTLQNYADDLIEALQIKFDQPVIGVGHSLGGMVTILAAIKRPELFSKVILIDPASTPTVLADAIFKCLPKTVHETLFPFIKGSLQRRRIWDSREQFINKYRNHRTFRRFTNQALKDYAQYGLKRCSDNKFELVFSPDWEAFNFRKVRFLWDSLIDLKHPTLFLKAEHRSLYNEKTFNRQNRRLGKNVAALMLTGTSHLMTHEQPKLLGATILEWLDETTS
ncbi:MAG: alpha/beta hydrolase [Acidiferrobacterales bacterium]|nr:alpha/beta hydrolase [Acidiferrobacterales bacterium]